MDKIAEFIVGLFRDLKLPFRWVAVGSLLVLIIFGFLFFERSTGQFYYSRLERKITLLSELQKLKDSGIEQDPELSKIYQDLVDELESFGVERAPVIAFKPVDISDPITIGKAISGAFLWTLIFVIGLSSEIKKAKKMTGMILALLVFFLLGTLLFAWVGMIIPTIVNPWVNYIGIPVVQIILLAMLTRKMGKSAGTARSQNV